MELYVRDVARLFATTEKKVLKWIDEKNLPAREINGQLRFHRAELLEWSTLHQIPLSEAVCAEPASGAPPPGLVEALETGGIHHDVAGSDRDSALRAVVGHMPLPEDADRDLLVDVLLAREALGSTGLGDGIAIPHVRNPILLHVPRPMVSLCFLAGPVDFGALDGQPVFALFSMISPSVKIHLHLLSRLAFMLMDPAFKEAIRSRAPAAEILGVARGIEARLAQKAGAAAPGSRP